MSSSGVFTATAFFEGKKPFGRSISFTVILSAFNVTGAEKSFAGPDEQAAIAEINGAESKIL